MNTNDFIGALQNFSDEELTPQAIQDAERDIHQQKLLLEHLESDIDLKNKQLDWLDEYEQFQRRLQSLEEDYMGWQKDLDARKLDVQALERYDSVVGLQGIYEEIRVRRGDVRRQQEEFEKITAELLEKQRAEHDLSGAFEAAKVEMEDAQKQYALRRDALNKGYGLMGEIEEATKAVEKLSSRLKTAESVAAERFRAAERKKEEAEKVQKSLQETRAHQQALSVHRVIFERMELISDKLQTFKSEREISEEDKKKQEQLNQKSEKIQQLAFQAEQNHKKKIEQLASLKSQLEQHASLISGKNGEQIREQLYRNEQNLLAISHATPLWQRIASGYEQLQTLRQSIARQGVEIEQAKNEIRQLEGDLAASDELFKHLNENFILSNSKDIQLLRAKLKENQPCAVCGATHHPYHTDDDRVEGENMKNLSETFQHVRDKREATTKRRDELALQLKQKEGEYRTSQHFYELMRKSQSADEEEWQIYASLDRSFSECSPSVNREARELMLSMLHDSNRKMRDRLRGELDDYNKHVDEIKRLREEIEQLQNEITSAASNLESLHTDLKINDDRADQLASRIALSEKTCEQLYTDLDEMITIADWFPQWLNNPETFRSRLFELGRDWHNTLSSIDELQDKEIILQEEVKTATDSENETRAEANQIRDEYDYERERLERKKEELRQILAGNLPENEEETIKRYVEKTEKAAADARQKWMASKEDLKAVEGRYAQAEQAQKKSEEQYTQKSTELDLELNRFNAYNSPLQIVELDKIFQSNRDWKALRTEIEALRERKNIAQFQVEQARRHLLNLQTRPHQPSGTGDETREAILRQREQLKIQKQDLEKKFQRLQLLILAYSESRRH